MCSFVAAFSSYCVGRFVPVQSWRPVGEVELQLRLFLTLSEMEMSSQLHDLTVFTLRERNLEITC